jgi:hypothetical protein
VIFNSIKQKSNVSRASRISSRRKGKINSTD